ncbi:MAG TPA: glycosyltransferase family 1 protein [Bryobacteraceae bacterium]|nr:glycosyltransferase family 1 protein [Bryobacteraceae bacterium]
MQRMRVALDATPLTVATGGVTRYTAELARALAGTFRDDEFWLVSDQPFEMPARMENLRRGFGPRGIAERKWWLWGVQSEMTRLNIDVFHGTDFSVPYLPLRPSVLMLHDLSPWKNPRWQPSAGRIRHRTPILLRLGLATMVATPSEVVRKEAIERFHLEPERVVALPLAAAPHFHPVPERTASTPYFLFTGTLEPRKNVGCIIDAWRIVRQRHEVELRLAGRRREDFPPVAPEPGLRVLGAVEEDALPALYSGAVASLYPSFYEGFGLPVLEAMQCGAMVIASRDAALTEVAAGGALQIAAENVPAWAEAMEAALVRPDLRMEWRSKALKRAAEFSWTRTATGMREIYDEARRRFGR